MLRRVLVVLVAVPVVLILSSFSSAGSRDRVAGARRVQVPDTASYGLDGLNETVTVARFKWWAGVKARVEFEQAVERARAARVVVSPPSHSGGSITGTCAAMKPAGFPDSIINRESRADPNAVNASSGARGCAQIMPFHFSRGSCVGLDYAACWAKLWAGGAGASHWACTRESGCR